MNGDEIIATLLKMRGPWLGDGFTKINRDEIINEIKRLQDAVNAAPDNKVQG